MFGKIQAKILLRYYEQTLLNFIKPFSLHKPPYCFTLPSYQWVYGQISENIFFFWTFLCRNSSLTKTIDSSSFLQKTTETSHCSYSQTRCIFLTHSTMSAVGEETSYGFRWKLYCYSSPSHVTREILFLRLLSVFLSYFLYFSSLLGIRQPGSLLHGFLTSIYLVLGISCWPKVVRACLIDQQQ